VSFVTDAVRRNAHSCRATNASLEKDAQHWLRQAGDRDGGRLVRYNKKHNAKESCPATTGNAVPGAVVEPIESST